MDLMTSLISLLLLLNLQAVADLDEAIEALDNERPLGRVSVEIGNEAVKRMRPTTSAEEFGQLVQIAQAAKVRVSLERRLVEHILERGAGSWIAAKAIATLPERQRNDLLERTPLKRWTPALQRLLQRRTDDTTTGAILTLLLPRATLAQVKTLAQNWRGDERLGLLLERLSLCAPALYPDLFKLLLELRPSEEQDKAFCAATRGLVPHPAVAKAVVEQLERGRFGPFDAFLRAAGALPPSLWPKIEQRIVDQLSDEDRQVLAIRAAAETLCHQLLELLPQLSAKDRPTAIRVAAIQAVLQVGYRDAPTIDRLIRLLSDREPEVAKAAYAVLLRKGSLRLKLPMRTKDWLAWRQTQSLPDAAPLGPEERLAKLREQREVQYRIVHSRLLPPAKPKAKCVQKHDHGAHGDHGDHGDHDDDDHGKDDDDDHGAED